MDYRVLRAWIGYIAFWLVPIVYIGNWLIFTHQFGGCFYNLHGNPGSLSGFYYTHMRNVFVGAMCAMGVFLAAYRGYDRWDSRLTNFAGLAAICIALFPTMPPPNRFFTPANRCGPSTPITYHPSPHQSWFRDVHVASLIVLFLMVFLMVLVQFTRTQASKTELRSKESGSLAREIRELWNGLFPLKELGSKIRAWWKGLFPVDQPRNRLENRFYVGLAGGIAIAAVLAVVPLFWRSAENSAPLLLFSEAIAFFSFGIAWYIKGGGPQKHWQLLLSALSWVRTRLLAGGTGDEPVTTGPA